MWQQFRPRRRGTLNEPTAYEPDSVYAKSRQIVAEALHQTSRLSRDPMKRSSEAAKRLRQREATDSAHLLAMLILQTPAAVRAQAQMDRHQGGYNNRQARVFELIDFNDTFVDVVLSLPSEELSTFPVRLKAELLAHCERMHTACFNDRQFEAIVHGLSREIAVFRGAKQEGLVVRMTSRVQDSRGVDMIITDPDTKRAIAIDCKTHSSFHFRLLRLQEKRRINEQYRLACEMAGFCKVEGGRRDDPSPTVLVRISTEHLGPIHNFAFEDTTKLGILLRQALEETGEFVVH